MMRTASFASLFTLLTLLAVPALAQDDDVASRVDAICCGGNCCLIAGDCFSNGDMNPDNACQTCDVSETQTSWTDVSGCTPPDSGVTPPADSGTTTPPAEGGGCSASTASSGASPLAFLGLLGALLVWRRRA